MKARRFAIGQGDITAAYPVAPILPIALTVNAGLDALSQVFSWDTFLDRIEVQLSTLAGLSAAPRLFCVLSADVLGNTIVSREDNQAIRLGFTAATNGTAIHDVSGWYPRTAYNAGAPDTIYAWLRLDQGSGVATARAINEQQHD